MSRAVIPWLIVYVVLALIYTCAVPLYESPDEIYHYAMIDEIARTGELPVQMAGVYQPYKQEASQPPLYYLIGALIVAPVADRDDFIAITPHNPHVNMGTPGLVGNKNRILHDNPYQINLHGSELATRLARLLSVALGVITVIGVYHSARIVAPSVPAVAHIAAGLTVFNAQFLFISASVNNDNLVTALNSLIIWQVLALLRDGITARRALVLATLAALASLSKLSGLVMYPVIGVAALIAAWRARDWRGLVGMGVTVCVVWAMLAGWWYARNLTLYGELFGTNTMLEVFGRRDAPTLPALLTELSSLTVSYWGVFGWFNVLTFDAYYLWTHLLMAGGAVGFGLWLAGEADSRARQMAGVLAFSFALGLGALTAWTLQTTGTQGRLLFPYLTAVSVSLALGIVALSRRARRLPPGAALIPLGVSALVIPFVTLIPEYRPPDPLPALPHTAAPLDVRWGDQIALAGYTATPQRYDPGDTVHLTLYWRPIQQTARDLSLYAHLIDATSGAVIAKVDSFPALGRLRTSTWSPGALYPDAIQLRLPDTTTGAFPLAVYVGWRNNRNDRYQTTTTGENGIALPVGGFGDGALPDAPPVTPDPAPRFADLIALQGYSFDPSTGDLRLWWRAERDAIDDDLRVLAVILADEYQPGAETVIVAQADSAPALPVAYWRRGDAYVTHHTFRLADAPGGVYPLYVGWYSALRPYRLPVDLAPDQDGFYHLTRVRVP